MRPTTAQSKAILPEHSLKTAAAISLLDDASSLPTRVGAASYLKQHSDYPDAFLALIWRAMCTERSPYVVTAEIQGLAELRERAASSVPLLAYFLNDERPGVAGATAETLLSLSHTIEYALIPLFANPLASGARKVRDSYLDSEAANSDPYTATLVRESKLLSKCTRQERSKWLSELPTTGLDTLSTSDRLRFMLIFADPECRNVWSCLKVLWYSEKSTSANTQAVLQQLAVCEGSFLRRITTDGLYIKTRYLAQALADTQPHVSALAPSIGSLAEGLSSHTGLLRHIAAVKLAPDFPPPVSFDAILEALWWENDRFERELALRGLHEVMPLLGDESAQYLIEKIFHLLRDPPKLRSSMQGLFCREVCEIITQAKSNEIPLILNHIHGICESSAPVVSKKAAIHAAIHLEYDGSSDPFLRDARELLERYRHGSDRAMANISRYAFGALRAKFGPAQGASSA